MTVLKVCDYGRIWRLIEDDAFRAVNRYCALSNKINTHYYGGGTYLMTIDEQQPLGEIQQDVRSLLA